jgi:hypothetical protein
MKKKHVLFLSTLVIVNYVIKFSKTVISDPYKARRILIKEY